MRNKLGEGEHFSRFCKNGLCSLQERLLQLARIVFAGVKNYLCNMQGFSGLSPQIFPSILPYKVTTFFRIMQVFVKIFLYKKEVFFEVSSIEFLNKIAQIITRSERKSKKLFGSNEDFSYFCSRKTEKPAKYENNC